MIGIILKVYIEKAILLIRYIIAIKGLVITLNVKSSCMLLTTNISCIQIFHKLKPLEASNSVTLVTGDTRKRFAKSLRGAIRNLKSNFPGGVAARIYESTHYSRVTLGTGTPLASGNASVMKRGGQEAIVVNSQLPTYSESEKEVRSSFCPRWPALLLLQVIPLRAINPTQ